MILQRRETTGEFSLEKFHNMTHSFQESLWLLGQEYTHMGADIEGNQLQWSEGEIIELGWNGGVGDKESYLGHILKVKYRGY